VRNDYTICINKLLTSQPSSLRTSFRAAILTSKNAIDALKKSNRDELLFHPQFSEKVEADSRCVLLPHQSNLI